MIGSHLDKKKGARLEKWDTLANWVTLKKMPHLKNGVTLGNIGHT